MADDQRLQQLKTKYASVLNFIQQQGQVSLSHVHVENNKLLIQGTAPSEDAKNKVWDQIKLANPNYQEDLVADITVVPSAQSQSAPAQAAAPQARTYTVQAGDSLSKIAKEFYGNANEYMKIFNANKDKLSDPNKIQPGQVLNIPA